MWKNFFTLGIVLSMYAFKIKALQQEENITNAIRALTNKPNLKSLINLIREYSPSTQNNNMTLVLNNMKFKFQYKITISEFKVWSTTPSILVNSEPIALSFF